MNSLLIDELSCLDSKKLIHSRSEYLAGRLCHMAHWISKEVSVIQLVIIYRKVKVDDVHLRI